MIAISSATAVVAGMVLAAWLIAAVWTITIALKRKKRAERAAEAARQGGALLENAPAVFLIVDRNDRLQCGPRVAEWFGLAKAPSQLDVLQDKFSAEMFDSLAKAVRAARRTAKPFSMELQMLDSARIYYAQGGPSPPIIGDDDSAIVWLFDASAMREEFQGLNVRLDRTLEALDGISALIEAAPFPMWHRGPDLRLTLVNQAYVEAVDADNAADAIARGLELIEARGEQSPAAVAARVQEEGEAEVRNVSATIDGERRSLRVADVPLGEAGVAGYAMDVQDLENARAELRYFERAQRDMLDLLSAGVAQFNASRELVFNNQPFQRIFAIQDEWLAENPEFDRVFDRMREAGRLPEERDYPAWKAERREWFRAGNEPIEEMWHLSGGVYIRVVAQPLPDGGLLLIFEDRTEQAQLASARDTLLRVRAATFDNLFEAVGVFAGDGRLHLWNTQFRELWDLDEPVLDEHPHIDDLISVISPQFSNSDDANDIRDAVRIAASDREESSHRLKLNNGRYFDYAVVPLPDGNALFTMLDISDSQHIESALRERNEALEAADRVKSAFVSNMSYELRTPLTSIAGFAEMLDAGYAGEIGEQAQGYVDAILESVMKLRGQIDDILDLTQGEAGGLPMARDEVDLQRLCDSVVSDTATAIANRKLKLDVDIDWSVGGVIGDERRLRQALTHVLGNAVRYTPEGGEVSFLAAGDATGAKIVVRDNGAGIASENQQTVFERFSRSGEANDRALGLGLPLTKQFVEAHGGTVVLESVLGQGTTITITIPRSDAV